ncbi:MAG: CHASE2 domain-containing protein [Mariprofundaceae bacterium]
MKRGVNRLASSSNKLVPSSIAFISSLCYKSSGYFYWALALVMTIVIGTLALMKHDVASINGATFDTVMKMRWTSPEADKNIVILDIDENSLAEMARDYGRWPWSRDVFAQALAELEFAEAKSILFTILITDPDTEHPKSDATLSFVASESFVTVYPLVRLPKENDAFSQLEVCDLIAPGVLKCKPGIKVAAILPGLPGMRHDLGMINHKLDEDGVLRRGSLVWNDAEWSFPTMVGGALSLANIKPKVKDPSSYILNWRNEKNSYQKISFSDYMASLMGDERIEAGFFKDKHVIISVSALGLAVQKTTANGLQDGGDIIATALDDAINGTHLKPLPRWIVLLLTVLFLWSLAALFVFRRSQSRLDGIFAAIQAAVVGVMAVAVNYTTYFIDLTPLVTFGMAYYGVGRIHHMMASKVLMGASHYMDRIMSKDAAELNGLGLIGFDDRLTKRKLEEQLKKKVKKWNMRSLIKSLDSPYVFFTHDAFQKNQMFESANDVVCVVVLEDIDAIPEILDEIIDYLKERGVEHFVSQVIEIPSSVRDEQELIPKFITAKTLTVTSQVMST